MMAMLPMRLTTPNTPHLWPGFSRRWYMVTGLAWAARPTANSITITGRPSTSRQRM